MSMNKTIRVCEYGTAREIHLCALELAHKSKKSWGKKRRRDYKKQLEMLTHAIAKHDDPLRLHAFLTHIRDTNHKPIVDAIICRGRRSSLAFLISLEGHLNVGAEYKLKIRALYKLLGGEINE